MAKNAELKIYGQIGSPDCNSKMFTEKVSSLENEGYTGLTIRMHSPGGNVFDGFNIFNCIRQTKMNVKIVIDGIAASMASFIILATKDVEIAENGFIMIHRPTAYSDGDVDSHESTANLLLQIESLFVNEYSLRTGLSKEDVKSKWFNGKDNWISAQEAVTLKFASGIIPAMAKDVNIDKSKVQSMGSDAIFNRFAASIGTTAISSHFSNLSQNWNWYQTNDPKALEKIQTENPVLFGELYKAEYGCYPDGYRHSFHNHSNNIQVPAIGDKDWNWYQTKAVKELESMKQENPVLFRELYKAEYGNYPE